MHHSELVVEHPHERQVLIRCRDEEPRVARVPLAPGQLLVLATPAAHDVPTFAAELPVLLSAHTTGITTVWLGVGGLTAVAATRLAGDLGIEVVTPDGGVAATPGAALYAGHAVGGTGWHRFAPGGAVSFHGARVPLPEWESWLPAEPVEVAGLVATPAPCGLVAGSAATFAVPVNQRFPKLVVAGPAPSPEAVAALLARLPDRPIMVVPAHPDVASHIWLVELAMRLSRDVVFSAGTQTRTQAGALSTVVPDAAGNRLFRPFPLVLRQSARGGDQQVLDIAAAPPGWERAGPLSYRLTDGGVVADVVPSGLVLRAEGGDLPEEAAAAPFDPTGWTLALGTAGEPLGLPVLTAAEDLLMVLPEEQRASVRVRMVGLPDKAAERALDRFAHRRKPVPEPARASVAPAPVPVSTPGRPAAPASVSDGPSTPAAERATAPNPGPAREPDPGPGVAPAPVPAATPAESTPDPSPPAADAALPVVASPPVVTTSAAPVSTVSGPGIAPVPVPVSPPLPQPPAPPPAPPLDVPVKGSTVPEQTRFAAAAGESFGEALATVNAAMATWPSMRMDESPGAKADYVAVCLFLGRDDGSARAVNGALRVGQSGVLDGQVPCLMSGLRRLPTHRRAVLRQGKADETLEDRSRPGTVLTEPGFLVASIDLDVTVPGADLDVLIWPSTARRTSELMLGRPIDEAVFVAGARFKALAVRTAADDQDGDNGAGSGDNGNGNGNGAPAPRIAVLYRELAPGETPATTELDERDLAVLAKLDSVLARRYQGALRLVDDPDVTARLTTSLVAWQERAGASAVAS